MALKQMVAWYQKYERSISSLSLVGGFIFDSLTLRRIDLVAENVWMLFNLILASIGIILLNVYENKKEGISEIKGMRIHFWLLMLIQFAFGGLMSTILVFYFRGATLAISWPFLLLLLVVFIGNEIFKKHYARLSYQVSVLFIAIYSFSIFIIPVLLRRMGAGIFILSGLASLLVLGIFLYALWHISRERFKESKNILIGSVMTITILLNIFYFTNIIPPLPLTLKDAGIYYSIVRTAQGNYMATREEKQWSDYLKTVDTIHKTSSEPLYAYTSIFSPARIDAHIIHDWQYYDEQKKIWVSSSRIPLSIVGGRDGGFRTYSLKYATKPGLWRVDVETSRGQHLGRIRFNVEEISAQRVHATTTLE